MAQTSLEPWKFVWDMGSSSHSGLIMAPDQEANGDNFGNLFNLLYINGMLSALIRIALTRQF